MNTVNANNKEMKLKLLYKVRLRVARPHTARTVLLPGGRVEHHFYAGWSPVTPGSEVKNPP